MKGVLAFIFSLLVAVYGLVWLWREPVVSSAPIVTQSPAQFTQVPNAPDINAIFAGVNAVRLQYGLKPLVANADLTKIAEGRANDMAKRDYYAHKNPDGKYFDDLLVSAGIYNQYACENLDLEFTTDSQLYVEDWLMSTHGHRECLLNGIVSQAGYAVARFPSAVNQGQPVDSFVVVAIHATPAQEHVATN